jgi:hypothetical protein
MVKLLILQYTYVPQPLQVSESKLRDNSFSLSNSKHLLNQLLSLLFSGTQARVFCAG